MIGYERCFKIYKYLRLFFCTISIACKSLLVLNFILGNHGLHRINNSTLNCEQSRHIYFSMRVVEGENGIISSFMVIQNGFIPFIKGKLRLVWEPSGYHKNETLKRLYIMYDLAYKAIFRSYTKLRKYSIFFDSYDSR